MSSCSQISISKTDILIHLIVLLDNIEATVENACSDVGQANDHLREAVRHKASANIFSSDRNGLYLDFVCQLHLHVNLSEVISGNCTYRTGDLSVYEENANVTA